jgi:PEP-CTERM motif
MKKAYLSLILAIAVVAFTPLMARADVLSPGGSGSPDAFSTPTVAVPDGTVANTGVLSWSWVNPNDSSTHAEGLYQEFVFSDPNNSQCQGCMTFVFAVGLDQSSTDYISEISTALFGSFLTDVGYDKNLTEGGYTDVVPSSVSRGLDGNTINFLYSGGLLPGDGSSVLEIMTNARSWKAGTISLQDSQSINLRGYAPAVPEPATAAMLGLGLLVLGAGFTFKRRAATLA